MTPMKCRAMVSWMAAAVVGSMAQLVQSETTVFQDRISGYRDQREYYHANPMVILSQGLGGNYADGLVRTNWSGFVDNYAPNPGEEFVNIGQGGPNYRGYYSTLAVASNVTDRYGQVFVRIDDEWDPSHFLSVLMSSNSVPQISDIFSGGRSAGAGAHVIYIGGTMSYYNGGAQESAGAYPVGMHNLTINYDLTNKTYDVWLNSAHVVTNAGFYASDFGSTVRSIAIGGAYWSAGAPPIMSQWYWKSDNATAFTNCGTTLAPTAQSVVDREWWISSANVVFADPIKDYTENALYTNANSRVICPQDNGGGAQVVTHYLEWTADAGDELVNLASFVRGSYTTLAVVSNVSDRYGQIYARVANYHASGTCWLRLLMSANSVPLIPDTSAGASDAGADVCFIGNAMRYKDAGAEVNSVSCPPDFYGITLNYDLQTKTYDIWIGTNQVDRSVNFEAADFGATVRSIAIGAADWGSGLGYAAMDQWYWRSRSDRPFVVYGHALPLVVPPTGTIIMFH